MENINELTSRFYENAWSFVEDHPEHFNTGMKKAAFYAGCLVRILANIQPGGAILKKLTHLRITTNDLKGIFVESVTKIRQYDKEYPEVRKLEELFSLNFNSAELLADIDASFYFTEGLVLQRSFYPRSKNEKTAKVESDETNK